MKKATSRRAREPSAASLRELPPVELTRYRIRRNPYAARIAREGIEIVHHEPSRASLAEMPETDFSVARVHRNTPRSRAAESAARIQYGRGRPQAETEVGPTQVRSLRLPAAIWRALEIEARERRTTVHALLRELVASHILRRSPG